LKPAAAKLIYHVCLLALLAASALMPQTFDCRGEEPFWHVKVEGTTATLSRPGAAEQSYKGHLRTLSYLKPQWLVFRSASAGSGEPLVLTMRQESCYSTMADGPAMPYLAVLSLRADEVATGCCKPRVTAASSWTERLPDFLPGIRKCIIDSGVMVRSVGKAWPMNAGRVGVRLIDMQGAPSDCIVDAKVREIRFFSLRASSRRQRSVAAWSVSSSRACYTAGLITTLALESFPSGKPQRLLVVFAVNQQVRAVPLQAFGRFESFQVL
jgi:uncharacterized membrane protein